MFLITGCQRSGTKSASLLFNIHHEVQFNYDLDYHNLPKEHTLRSESSWMIAPFASHYHCPIINLVRNPLDVINSIMGIGFFLGGGHLPYINFVKRHMRLLDSPMQDTINYYLKWQGFLTTYPRLRIEDIHNAPKANHRIRAEYTYKDIEAEVTPESFSNLMSWVKYYGY